MNLWCLILIANLAAEPPPAPGSIRGIVRAAETGEPLFLAQVQLVPAPPRDYRWSGATGSTGEFRVDGLAPGAYRMTVTYAGRAPRTWELLVESGSVTEVEVDLLFKLYEVGTIVTTGSRQEEKVLEVPARVQVITGDETRSRTVLTPLDHMQGKPALDVARTGLNQGTVVIRGFNNIFSGAMLMLVDHRISRLPSLRYNAFNLIPTSYDDIKQVEVVSGPGSALYGPNSANGVLHIQTLSAFDSAGTSATVAGGNRGVVMGSARHAQLWGDRVGFKVTAQYHQGEDFPFDDPAEQFPREYTNKRLAVEGRVDVRSDAGALFAFSGGWNQLDAVELTPLGASQASGLSYGYGQARMTWGDWFAQTYVTANDAGDSFNLHTGDDFVDTSKLIVGEVQRRWGPHDRLAFITGVDMLLTRPQTGGTINGRNEDIDNIDELGGYVHAETELSRRWTLVAAVRLDGHSELEDLVVSPRAAVLYEPALGQRIRATYNRAFSTPSSTNLFLDLMAGQDIFAGAGLNGFDLWAKGVPESGFRFRRDAMGGVDGLYMQVPETMGGTPDHIPADATLMWPFIQQIIGPIPAPTSDEVSTVLATADPNTGSFVSTAPEEVRDIERLQPTITNTFEVGYTALFGGRFLVSADVYHNRIENFVGPLRIETPNVFFEQSTLRDYLLAYIPPAQADAIAAQLAGIPVGTVTPDGTLDPADLMLTYRNFGRVDLTGFDIGTRFRLHPSWTLALNYSYVSDNFLENVEGGIDVALNAPQHKAGAGIECRFPRYRLGAGVRVRYVDGFPVRSGVYSGYVDAYTLADVTATYEVLPKTHLGLTVQNAFDHWHQEFVGAPSIGRTALLRLTRAF